MSRLLLIAGIGVFASAATAASCRSGNTCSENADCAGYATQAGRCAGESGCSDGVCQAACSGNCKVARADENPCPEAQICTYAATTVYEEGGKCTNLPISCTTTEDCPLYRPRTDASWTCVEGVCRFPGYTYPWE